MIIYLSKQMMKASDWTITVPDKAGFEIATPVPAVVPPVRPTATSVRVSTQHHIRPAYYGFI